ncbi:UDP-glucose/GDP-mannose dehydrogenase family protein [Candidatus Woesearchaeota archaeon]|nr:UDP-glucose/GDP-mannose dehydrogenase family protein [Candidatus Woesearchaeota archaeon]
MNIAVIGLGYVGGTAAACFSDIGHNVYGIDHDENKVKPYLLGKAPFYEKGLDSLIRANLDEGRLKFTTKISEGIKKAEAIVVAVGTPPLPDGRPDITGMEKVAKEIGESLDHYAVIIEKSTVPIRTAETMDKIMSEHLSEDLYSLAACPEFLRESTAVYDFMNPDRIVMGTDDEIAGQKLVELYKDITAPVLHTSIKAAEIIKHASNAFLYMKIAFAYSVGQLCDAEGDVNAEEVLKGVGLDKRIGESFLQLGPGVGGMCFPKDLDAFISIFKQYDVFPGLFDAVREVNKYQKDVYFNKVVNAFDGDISNKKLGILGLAFKAGTDDMRMSASIDIIKALKGRGAKIIAYDPKAMENAKKELPFIDYAKNTEEVLDNSEALLILTEWPEFKDLDIIKMRDKVDKIIDGRNLYKTKRMIELGYKYDSMGRPLKAFSKKSS